MNKIVISLLNKHQENYKKKLADFLAENSFKIDEDDNIVGNVKSSVLLEEFENNNYLNEFSDTLTPLIVQQLMTYPDEKITNYLPYVSKKYEQFIINEVIKLKAELDTKYRELIRVIDIDFSNSLLKLNKETEAIKKEFIDSFLSENRPKLIEMAQFNPCLLLIALAKIRNPKLQYELLSLKNDNIDNIKGYINSLEETKFKDLVCNYFSYPLDISMQEYHKKWIGKNKIHVKFAKNVLGDRYELAKSLLKNYSEPNFEVEESNHGINFKDLDKKKKDELLKDVSVKANKVSNKKRKTLINKKNSNVFSYLKSLSSKNK